jgi:membrane associated rhomboid family serine protease
MKDEGGPAVGSTLKARVLVLLLFVGSMWMLRIVDTFGSGRVSAIGMGIVPRTAAGLRGILVAPFIHENFGHLIANTVPLVILGALVLLSGIGELVLVIFVTAIVGGLGTWLFGSDAQHIGASGIVFGLFGYLVFRTIYDFRVSSALITLAVGIYFASSMLLGLVPREHISWTGHFFGFIGGVVAARIGARRQTFPAAAARRSISSSDTSSM